MLNKPLNPQSCQTDAICYLDGKVINFANEIQFKIETKINEIRNGVPPPEYVPPGEKVDLISSPPHYTSVSSSTYETINVIEAWNLDFHLGNVVKYVSRAGKKTEDPLQDLEKALWYLKRKIERIKEERKSNNSINK